MYRKWVYVNGGLTAGRQFADRSLNGHPCLSHAKRLPVRIPFQQIERLARRAPSVFRMLFAKPNDDVGININAECILRNLQNLIAPSRAAHHLENGNHGDRLKIDQPRSRGLGDVYKRQAGGAPSPRRRASS